MGALLVLSAVSLQLAEALDRTAPADMALQRTYRHKILILIPLLHKEDYMMHT